MVVTLPGILFLLDVWPLARAGRPRDAEKVPFVALSVGAIVMTVAAQHAAIAADLPLTARLGNAALSYVRYLCATFWPSGLAFFYPYRTEIPPRVARGRAFLLAATAAALRIGAYVAVGWLWYVGTLLPVIGIIQVGDQSRADRFTYVPLVGIFGIAAWGGADLARR